jgi:hypothetical protein
MPQAIFLNSRQRTISPIEVFGLADLQSLVEGWIEAAPCSLNAILYVNEEGLLRKLPYGFRLSGGGNFFGNGVLVGPASRDGEDTNFYLPPKVLADIVTFF